jgi:Tol biopolymer transport system component
MYSPDGGAIVFVSNETGRREVYVAALRDDGRPGPAVLASRGTGAAAVSEPPRWRADGRAVLYVDSQERLQSSEITRAPRLAAAPPRVLFDLRALGLTENFDVLPDGRLLAVERGDNEGPITRYDVILGFTGELERAAGAR